MSRRSPLDAVMWQKLIEEGEVKCLGCDDFVDLSDCENVNEGVDTWNEHVADCPGDPEVEN